MRGGSFDTGQQLLYEEKIDRNKLFKSSKIIKYFIVQIYPEFRAIVEIRKSERQGSRPCGQSFA